LFLRLIKFIIVPLVLATIVVGVTSTSDVKKLGRLGGKTIAYYLVTSFVAISLGLLAGFVSSPGTGVDVTLEGKEDVAPEETEGVIQTILNIVPTNPLEALAEGEILQIIFFAIFIGIGITVVGERAQPVQQFFDGLAEIMYKITNMNMTIVRLGLCGFFCAICVFFIGIGITVVGERAQPVQQFFDGLAEIMYKITNMIMTIVPLGIFGLLAPIVGEYGASVLLPLIKLILAMLIACLIHVFVFY